MATEHIKRRRSRLPKAANGDDVAEGDASDNSEGSSSYHKAHEAHEYPYEALPTPTTSFPLQQQVPAAAAAALITQEPSGTALAKRASVVTVYSTENSTNAGPAPSTSSTGTKLPLGIIIGSVAVGVVLAIIIVGGYLWWGTYGSAKKKKKAYNNRAIGGGSTARLGLSAPTSPTSPGLEKKAQLGGPPPRSSSILNSHRSKSGPSTPTHSIPTLPNRETPTHPPKSHERRTRAVAVPPPHMPASPASSSKALTPSVPAPAARKSEEDLTSSPGRAKSYVPQKRSPLAASAPPREKPKEKPKVNEWARPLSPGAGKSEDGHAMSKSEDHGVTDESAHTNTSTAVGTTEDYDKSKADEDGDQPLVYAYPPQPANAARPVVSELRIPDNRQPTLRSPGAVPLPVSALSSSPDPNRTPMSARQVPLPGSAASPSTSPTPSRSYPNPDGARSASRASEKSARQVALPLSQTSSPIPPSFQPKSTSPIPIPILQAPSSSPIQQQQPQGRWQSPAPSAFHYAAHPSSGSVNNPRAVSRTSRISNESYYTGEEGDQSYTAIGGAPGSAVTTSDYASPVVMMGAMDGVRESMIGLAYGGEEEEGGEYGVEDARSPFEEEESHSMRTGQPYSSTGWRS
ncbi:hypothetical protein FRB98_008046 [Tulasnella sp. 332]|nr:hypothetical protein FRB98_008046 [Tulasnella sp. 332]